MEECASTSTQSERVITSTKLLVLVCERQIQTKHAKYKNGPKNFSFNDKTDRLPYFCRTPSTHRIYASFCQPQTNKSDIFQFEWHFGLKRLITTKMNDEGRNDKQGKYNRQSSHNTVLSNWLLCIFEMH